MLLKPVPNHYDLAVTNHGAVAASVGNVCLSLFAMIGVEHDGREVGTGIVQGDIEAGGFHHLGGLAVDGPEELRTTERTAQ